MNADVALRMETAEDHYLDDCRERGVTPDSDERVLAMLSAALDPHSLIGTVRAIAWGWDEYEGEGTIDFRDDDFDSDKFLDLLRKYLLEGPRDGD